MKLYLAGMHVGRGGREAVVAAPSRERAVELLNAGRAGLVLAFAEEDMEEIGEATVGTREHVVLTSEWQA